MFPCIHAFISGISWLSNLWAFFHPSVLALNIILDLNHNFLKTLVKSQIRSNFGDLFSVRLLRLSKKQKICENTLIEKYSRAHHVCPSENLGSLIKACWKSESKQILVKLKRVLLVFALLQGNIKHLQVSECKANYQDVGRILSVKLLKTRKLSSNNRHSRERQ